MKRYSQQLIGDLLDKFMNGLTTPDEEAALGDYFRTHDVPEQWEDYRLMFDYFDRGMEGELLSPQASVQQFTSLMNRRWRGIAAAAVVAAAIGTLTVLRYPTHPTTSQPPAIAETQAVDTPTVIKAPAVETQQLAVVNPPKPTHRERAVTRTPSKTHRLRAQNDSLRAQNERLQRELDDLRRRAFIIDMEANGYKAVMCEDGRIGFIDMEQKIENEFNHQTTNNIPEI